MSLHLRGKGADPAMAVHHFPPAILCIVRKPLLIPVQKIRPSKGHRAPTQTGLVMNQNQAALNKKRWFWRPKCVLMRQRGGPAGGSCVQSRLAPPLLRASCRGSLAAEPRRTAAVSRKRIYAGFGSAKSQRLRILLDLSRLICRPTSCLPAALRFALCVPRSPAAGGGGAWACRLPGDTTHHGPSAPGSTEYPEPEHERASEQRTPTAHGTRRPVAVAG
jgi:hypothetical protein